MDDTPSVFLDRPRLAMATGAAMMALVAAGIALRPNTAPTLWVAAVGFACAAVVAAVGIGKAPCPECGALRSVVWLRNNRSLQCSGCGCYFLTKEGVSMLTDADAVEARPVFTAECPNKDIRWPHGCCVCGGAVEEAFEVSLEVEGDHPWAGDMATRVATLGVVGLKRRNRYEVSVPVCGVHARDGSDPAALTWNHEHGQLHIAFRSRRYADAFAQANGPVFWDD